MGVSWVFHSPLSDASGSTVIAAIEKRLEACGLERTGKFSVDAVPYVPSLDAVPQTVFLCHHSSYPLTTFTIVPQKEGDPTAKPIKALADRQFDAVVDKLNAALAPKPNSTVECHGNQFEAADFVVRVGAASISTNFKGVLIEVEYQPCIIPSLCRDLLLEFCRQHMAAAPADPPAVVRDLIRRQAPYQPIDTLLQYMDYFTLYRKGATAQPPPPQQQLPQPVYGMPPGMMHRPS